MLGLTWHTSCSSHCLRPHSSLLFCQCCFVALQADVESQGQLRSQLAAVQEQLGAAKQQRQEASARHAEAARQREAQLAELHSGVEASAQQAEALQQDLRARCAMPACLMLRQSGRGAAGQSARIFPSSRLSTSCLA